MSHSHGVEEERRRRYPYSSSKPSARLCAFDVGKVALSSSKPTSGIDQVASVKTVLQSGHLLAGGSWQQSVSAGGKSSSLWFVHSDRTYHRSRIVRFVVSPGVTHLPARRRRDREDCDSIENLESNSMTSMRLAEREDRIPFRVGHHFASEAAFRHTLSGIGELQRAEALKPVK